MNSDSIKNVFSKTWVILAAIIMVVLVGFVGRAIADDGTVNNKQRMVTVYDRGAEQTIITKARTVRAALEQANVTLDPADMVEPGLDAELVAEQYSVNVYRARPVIVEDGTKRVRTFTAAQSPVKIAASAKLTLYPEDKTSLYRIDDVVSEGGAGLKLVIDRATPFTFVLYGKQISPARTQAKTVGGMLKEKGVKLGKNDGSSVPLSTPLVEGMTVKVWRNGVQTVTQEEDIAMPVEQVQDQDREIGFKTVQVVGKPGKKQVTYEINMQDGHEVSRKIIQEVQTLAPVKQVEVVGAKYGGGLGKWLSDLRACETHGNYATNTGNGFYGAYQFMQSTWDSVARKTGRHDLVGMRPDQASPLDQDAMIIANTNMTAGLRTQNPGCYAKMSLSNYPPAQ